MTLAPDRSADRPGGGPGRSYSGHPTSRSLAMSRLYTSPGVDPYDEVVWERRDARITNWKDGTVAFEQLDVEFPTTWSMNATNIVAQKYFRGTGW
jgi:ribonucleoside-diphosphate reductase alpha chain